MLTYMSRIRLTIPNEVKKIYGVIMRQLTSHLVGLTIHVNYSQFSISHCLHLVGQRPAVLSAGIRWTWIDFLVFLT